MGEGIQRNSHFALPVPEYERLKTGGVDQDDLCYDPAMELGSKDTRQ